MTRTLLYPCLIVGLVVVCGPTGCSTNESPEGQNPTLMFTFPVLEQIARELIPPTTPSSVLLPAGASPHGYEPSPSLVAAINRSSALFLAHPDLDGWAGRFAPDKVQVFWGTEQPASKSSSGESRTIPDTLHQHEHLTDTHYWTDPVRVREILPTLTDSLCDVLEASCADIRVRAQAFGERLDSLTAGIQQQMAPLRGKSIVTSHPFLDHFLDRFGIHNIGSIRPIPGQDARPATLAALLSSARSRQVLGLVAERYSDLSGLKVVAADADLYIVEIDPLGHDSRTYEEYIGHIAEILLELRSPLP